MTIGLSDAARPDNRRKDWVRFLVPTHFGWDAVLTRSWILIGLMLLAIVLRLVAHDAAWLLLLVNAFTFWIYLPAYAIITLALWKKRWPLAACAGVIVLFHLAWAAPKISPDPPRLAGPTLKLMSVNLLTVNPDPERIIREILDADPDVLALQEFSPRWAAAFSNHRFYTQWPHNIQRIREDSFGCAVFSKIPFAKAEFFYLDIHRVPQIRTAFLLNGKEVHLLNVHLLPPRTAEYAAIYYAEQDELLKHVRDLGDKPFIVMGDFNTTEHASFFREMTAVAPSAFDQAGSGFGFTWPNGLFWIPPLCLDHIFLAPRLGCRSFRLGRGDGSDHKPLVVEVGFRQ